MQKFNVSKEYRLNITTQVEMEEIGKRSAVPEGAPVRRRSFKARSKTDHAFNEKILAMQPGSTIIIAKNDWKYRTHPSAIIFQPRFRKDGQRYTTHSSYHGYHITRVS